MYLTQSHSNENVEAHCRLKLCVCKCLFGALIFRDYDSTQRLGIQEMTCETWSEDSVSVFWFEVHNPFGDYDRDMEI